MSRQMQVETLRDWLEAGEPVTVVDIRTDADRKQWAIPGSLHVDVYDELRAGHAGALRKIPLPGDRPIVTVCGAGQTSQLAADILAARGFDARSLAGGMKAWTLAWNVAEVPVSDPSLHVVQVRRTGKGCLSYIVGSQGEAVVIDPSVSSDVYLQIARRGGWTIRHVLDTHIHADHLSRAHELARRTGAQLVLPSQQRVRFPFSALADGDRLSFGRARLTAIRTPGHTHESTCYALNDAALFTGDTLFVNGVGRPDLHADPEEARERGRALFASLERLRALSRDLVVLPGHAGEPIPFDRRPVAARLQEIEVWLGEWMRSELTFVERVTSGLPPAPANFTRIVELNETGEPPDLDPTDLEAGANRCAVS